MEKTIRRDKTAHKIFLDRERAFFPFSEQEMCLCVELLLIKNDITLLESLKNTLFKSRILKAGLPERKWRSGQKTDVRHGAVIYAYRQKGQKYPFTAINCMTAVPEPLFINLTPFHISTVK